MSEAAIRAGALPTRRAAGEPSGLRPAGTLAVELGIFAALGAFALAQWARLVSDPPLARLGLTLLVLSAVAASLGALRGRRQRSRAARLAAGLLALAMLAAALLAVGLPARLLSPGNWGELREGLAAGLAGIEDVEMPYAGADRWVRLTLMLGAAAMLAAAGVLAFWPLRRRALGRVASLAALLTVYGTAVTLDSPGSELLWGVPLLVLAGAWLWLPGLARGRAGVSAAVLLAAGVVALPLAAALASERPWWNYESWDWFGRDRAVSFNWEHSYGPLEWPTEGTTLLEVRSRRPLYWKATVLDRFDGFTWQRAEPGEELAGAEYRARSALPDPEALTRRHPEWVDEASFEVRALSSELAVGAGQPLAVDGIDFPLAAPDGTLTPSGEPLQSGAEYTVAFYAPDPSSAQMRRAPAGYPQRFSGSTLIGLPHPSPSANAASAPIEVPLWGTPARAARRTLLASPYADTYRLARRLTAGARTPFDAARAIEAHLREGYDYTHNVPSDRYPLSSFLFEERAGYCQQFSGAMALMTRMLGIPSRVVAGFAPGSYDAEAAAYEVRDLDAHSWVEVYLRGLGWVTFDPTPAAAPAASQEASAFAIPRLARDRGLPAQSRGRGQSLERALEGGPSPAVQSGGERAVSPPAIAILITGTLAAGAIAIVYLRRRHRLREGRCAEEQTHELVEAVRRLGWQIAPGSTLLSLERRFEELASRRAIATYAEGLRACRYAPAGAAPPGADERRRMRRALGHGGGWRRRLSALRAVPPGGPARAPERAR